MLWKKISSSYVSHKQLQKSKGREVTVKGMKEQSDKELNALTLVSLWLEKKYGVQSKSALFSVAKDTGWGRHVLVMGSVKIDVTYHFFTFHVSVWRKRVFLKNEHT